MKKSARHRSRELALQAIYQWQFTQDSISTLKTQFFEKSQHNKIDTDYFVKLLMGVITQVETLDEYMSPLLDRSLKELNPVELAVLRLGIYELVNCLEVPYKVVINEALELTKTFGSEEGFKYINGILDKVARKTRILEFQKST